MIIYYNGEKISYFLTNSFFISLFLNRNVWLIDMTYDFERIIALEKAIFSR